EFEFMIAEVSAGDLTLEPLETGGALPDPACFKGSLKYEARVSGSWAVTGSRSGFLHGNYTGETGENGAAVCSKNQDEEKNGFTGRAFTSPFKESASITVCPPFGDSAEVEWKTFKNTAFTFRIYPACSYDQDFKPQPEKEVRDTTLTFTASSGFVSSGVKITGRVSAILLNEYNQLIYAVDSTSNTLVEIVPETEKIDVYYY
ncbi:MAG: hypothetical protein FJ088_07240, partial [Deltaproteobacteria bacterium]|nr:hypothetical protein [Deltaproteobacteria bacterium]